MSEQIINAQISKLYLRNSRDELLVGVRAARDGKRACQLDFIGGGMELIDATPEDAALRELREEAAIRLQPGVLNFVDSTVCSSNNRQGVNVISYYDTLVSDDIDYWPNPEEFEDLFFMPIPEIVNNLEHIGQRAMLENYAAHLIASYELVHC